MRADRKPAPGAGSGTLRIAEKLTGAGTAIPVASGWQTLTDGTNPLTGTFDSPGGTTVQVHLSGSANVAIGAATRVIIAGGAFGAGTVITPDPASSMLVPGNVRISQGGWIDIAAAASTTYTVTAQGQGVGILSSITPNAGTNLIVHEHS